MITVLVTSIGSTTAISAAKALRKGKETYRIVGTDIYPSSEIPGTIFCDAIYQVPRYDSPDYIAQIIEICKKEKVEFIIPILDQEVEMIAKEKEMLLNEGVTACVSDYKTVQTCNDKLATFEYFNKRNINTPRVYLPKEKQMFFLRFPLFMKPRRGVSSKDCYTVNNQEEYEVLVQRIDEPIIQQQLSGKQYVIDVVNDTQSNNITAVVRHEISAKSGLGVKAVTALNEQLRAYAVMIAEKIKIQGAANVEVFVDGDKISLIEINPRLSAGSIISTAAGINIAELTIEAFSGKPHIQAPRTYKEGVYMTRYWEEVFYDNGKLMS